MAHGTASKNCLIGASGAHQRLDVFLKESETELSRSALQALIRQGAVRVNGASAKPHTRLKQGDQVTWCLPDPAPCGLAGEDIPLDILFEDDAVIVLNKPAGLVVHPGAGNKEHTLVHALLHHTRQLSSVSADRPGIVHRLDKDTSGVMVVARTNTAHLHLTRQFKDHSIERRYIAFVEGDVAFDEGVVDVPIARHAGDRRRMAVSFHDEAREAHTFYHVLKRWGSGTALELYPRTGRTHQLRVHLKYIGHPILGDPVYGRKGSFERLALHAKDLGFEHPVTGERVMFTTPLPGPMVHILKGVKL